MHLRTRQWCIVLFVIALSVRVAGIVATHQYDKVERFELERTALSLAKTGVFGNPYAIPTGPTAHVSPVYPVVLAGLFRVFGTGVPAEVVKQVFACAVTALQCALLPVIALRFGFSLLPGLLAGFAGALLPLKFVTETQGDWESNWAALALMLAAVLTVSVWENRRFTLKQAYWNGLCWGIALLVSWTFAPLFAAVMMTGLVFAQQKRKPYLNFGLVAVCCVIVCLAPWTLRNWRALGGFVPGRTNTGIELRISNNDLAAARESVNFERGVYHRYHPLQSVTEARKVLALGEVEYDRRLKKEALRWMAAHPGRFAVLTMQRFGLFWFYPDRQHLAKSAILWLRTFLSLVGLAVVWRAKLVSSRLIAVILVVVPLPNYLVHVALKHSYPIDWLLTLLAAVAVSSVLERFQGTVRPSEPRVTS